MRKLYHIKIRIRTQSGISEQVVGVKDTDTVSNPKRLRIRAQQTAQLPYIKDEKVILDAVGYAQLGYIGTALAISSPYVNTMWQDATLAILDGTGMKYVASINGTPATPSNGNIFILSSFCLDTYPHYSDQPEEYDTGRMQEIQPNKSTLFLMDNCATCQTCDKYMLAKQRVEKLKRQFWALKDINLYSKSVFDARKSYSGMDLMQLPVGCQALEHRDDILGATLFNLLGQYMTVVHMWNYIAQLRSQVLRITPSPDDVSGFVIYAQSPKLTCDGNTTISCQVTIKPMQVQEGLVAWIPEPETSFEPFSYAVSFPAVTVEDLQDDATGLGKVFSFSDSSAVVGTYTLLIRYLPYFHVMVYDPEQDPPVPIDPAEYDPTQFTKKAVHGDRGGWNIEYSGSALGVTTEVDETFEPTKEDYVASRSYPAASSADSNIWEITVAWTLSGTLDQSTVDVYYYTTPCVGQPMKNPTHDMSFHTPSLRRAMPIEIVEPEDEEDDDQEDYE